MRLNNRAFSLVELSIVVLVIGILVAGLSISSQLYYNAKLAAARTFSQSSDAASIKNMILWIDATQENALRNTSGKYDVSDGQSINLWKDRNPQFAIPLLFTNSSTDRYPFYRETAINGLPALEFDGKTDGTGDWLETSNDPRIDKPNNHSIFMVVTPIAGYSTTTVMGIFAKEASYVSTYTVSNPPYSVIMEGSTKKFSTLVTSDSNSGATATTSTTFNDGSAAIVTVTHNSVVTTSGLKIYLNGSSVGTATARTTVGYVPSKLYLGRQKYWANDRYFKGYIGEIIMYDRVLSTEEITAVQKYLSRKWSIKIS